MTFAPLASRPTRCRWYSPGLVVLLILALAFSSDATSAQSAELVLLVASAQPSAHEGATTTFTIAVDNPGQAPVTRTFPSSQLYDLVVSTGEREVWRWSADRMFALALSERTFPPGVTLLGRETWDWRDTSGNSLPPGIYRIVGSLATNPPQAGNLLEITLHPLPSGTSPTSRALPGAG